MLLFLLLGMLGGSEGIGGIVFDDYELAFRFGTIALILILFDGGLNTASSAIGRSLAPAGALATFGVLGTAGIVAVLARFLGLSWPESLLIGAIVSSTDAAAVFAVLRGGSLHVREPVRSTLEVESCINDPMAIILTITVVEILSQGPTGGSLGWTIASVPIQLIVGAAIGVMIGFGACWILNTIRLSTAGLYPVATLAFAFISYGTATLLLGNGSLPFKTGLTRVHDAIAWFAQVAMFLMLGLLVFPSQLLHVAGAGLGIGILLAVVARPVAAALCLLPFRYDAKEVAYCSWVGIRGAVPIVLATIPLMAGLPDGERIFNLVFFIVVVSAIVPGASIVLVTRRLGFEAPVDPPPAALLEMHSRRRLNGDIRIYRVHRSVAVCDVTLAEIPFPDGASALIVVRGDDLIPARGKTRLQEGDHVYVFCRAEDEPAIGLLFGQTIV